MKTKLVMVAAALAVALVVTTTLVIPALAVTFTAANKVVASSSTIVRMQGGVNGTSSSKTYQILNATMKTSTPEDLIISVTAESALFTTITARGGNNPSVPGWSSAMGEVKIWVTVDGKPVPVSSIPNLSAGGIADNGTVVFNNRVFAVKYNLSSLTSDQFMTWYLNTKSANGFNWMLLNVGSGTHTISVYATLTGQSSGTQPNAGEADIGARTLIIEPTKLANSAQV